MNHNLSATIGPFRVATYEETNWNRSAMNDTLEGLMTTPYFYLRESLHWRLSKRFGVSLREFAGLNARLYSNLVVPLNTLYEETKTP